MLHVWRDTRNVYARCLGRCFTSHSKQTCIEQRVGVQLRDEDLEESFVKGWGKGGQKINKVRNCVLLKHIPTGLHVRCQETRSLEGNRRIARRILWQKLDDQMNGEMSKSNLKILKLRKKKANRRSKSKQKYAVQRSKDEDDAADLKYLEDDDSEDEDSEGEDINKKSQNTISKTKLSK